MEDVLSSLPDDILRNIIKYLEPVDCLHLLSAGVWLFTEELLLEKRDICLSHCHNLSSSSLKAYMNQCIDPTRIQTFNASHCHWLPANLLVDTIQSMKGLKELYVEDTQLTLIHLCPIFLSCSKIKNISFSLRDVYLKEDQVIPYSMEDCLFNRVHFRQLTSLKMAWSEMFCSWPTVFEILGWCFSCYDLHLEQHFHHERFSQPDLEVIRRKQFPKLRWMENLNSFVYHQKGITHVSDPIFQALCQWIFTHVKFKNIERLWVPAEENQQVEIPRNIQSWHVGSILVNQHMNQFIKLTEIGGVELDHVPSLPNLRMADGSFSAYRCLFEFVTRQPQLEQLFVKADIMQEFHFIGDIRLPLGFQLTNLRKLVYSCCILDPVVMDKLVELCPNLEEISMVSEEPFDFFEPFNLSASFLDRVSQLQRLKKISIEGQISGNANVFQKIFGTCKQLETLILSGKHVDDDAQFLKSLCAALPLATNLRDLRIKWQHVTDVYHFKEMLAAISQCRQLRFLHIDCWGMIGEDHEEISSLPEFIVDVVEMLSHLISLSLQLKLNEWLLEKARIRIHSEILPFRPSFWFSNGLPMGDPILSITCLHCYEFGYDANESPCTHLRRLKS